MKYNRRKFLRLSAAGIAATAVSGSLMACAVSRTQKNPEGFGIQLYSLKDVIGDDVRGVLKQLSYMGFKKIESYEGPRGMFWGMKNTEFASFLSDLGMKMVSSHTGFQDMDRKAEQAAEIGMSHLIIPSVGPRKTADEFRKIADRFNASGEICRKHGVRFGYHNHAYSFKPVDGQLGQDIFMQNTDPDTVDFEMDIYWVIEAGEDPAVWFRKYPNRFRLCHVKDKAKGVPNNEQNHSCIIGNGVIDFKSILAVGKENGLQHLIYEQEAYREAPPLESARKSADYLKTLGI